MVLKKQFSYLLESYSYLLFSTNKLLGGILLVLSFVNPSAGIHALVAFFAASAFSKVCNTNNALDTHTRYLYNSLMTGLAIGFVYAVSPLSLLMSVVVGILTFLFSSSLHALFSYYLGLPILNLPFAIIATLVYLAAMQYSSLSHIHNSFEMSILNIDALPVAIQGLLRSIGVLLFLPYDWIGLIILSIVLVLSRINFFLIVMGYFAGTFFHSLLTGIPHSSVSNPFSFNYILIALSLGGYFLIPSKRTYGIALIGVCVSSILLDGMTVFWSTFGIPAFTLPFAITVLLFIHALYIAKYPFVTRQFRNSPEQNLEEWCTNAERFGVTLPSPRLPFSGEWTVYQGFDDDWTHQGLWRYAVDFVIEDPVNGTTFRHSGKRLEDFYCYNKPVLAPVSGTVVALVSTIPDNPIGSVNKEENWGNYIILYSDFGYYVELSHFANGSLAVNIGDRVVVGQVIGRCGNSGHSAQPHIHMQVQYWAYAGAPAVQFSFSQAESNGAVIRGETHPRKGDRFSSLVVSKKMGAMFQFLLDDTIRFRYHKNGVDAGLLELKVRMDVDGSYCLEDVVRKSKLYFIQRESEFLFTSYIGTENSPLRFLFTAVPSIPMTEQPVTWKDSLPASVVQSRLPLFAYLLKSFYHPLYSGKGSYKSENGVVRGSVVLNHLFSTDHFESELTLDSHARFSRVKMKMKGEIHVLEAL